MYRLIEKGLMFGNLIHIDSPVLVERYNRALVSLTGKRTGLAEFHVDIAGFSPEVGAELDDPLYLNHKGVNRQFILLTIQQETAPLLDAKFSTSRGVLKQFIEKNRAQLFALTARDAIAGELVNSVYALDSAAHLLDIRQIKIDADTTVGTVRTAAKLRKLIDQFKTHDDGWFDDVLIGEMIGLAKETGDVTRNPVALDQMSFDQMNFWTAHFGGIYVFREMPHPAVIATTNKDVLGKLPIGYVFDVSNRSAVAKFLTLNNLAEQIVEARGVDVAAILQQKMDFIVASVSAAMGENLSGATRRDLRQFGRRYATNLPVAWHGLAALLRWAEEGGPMPCITADHDAYFYTLRARNHADADLVNMLLAELCPLDIRQLFICHKDAFYAAYSTWSDEKRAYVVDFLDREYQVDKAGTRAALFGHDASNPSKRDMSAVVGPWGAVRRR